MLLEFVVTIEMFLWFPVNTAKATDADKSVEFYLCFISYSGLKVGGMVDNLQDL
jgi:hypothetical protein